jgi:membrane protein
LPSGAVAYYTLLSIVPLFVLLLVALSHLVDEQRLLDTVESNLDLLIPGQAAVITGQVQSFLAHREVVGVVGLLALVFFSTTAFTILENAMALIFSHRALLYALGVVGLALLLTALYMVLPVGGISFRHAWIGGVTATGLWELTRHLLVWYFAKLSMVNLIYGSLAAAIVVLLTLEAAALIVLLGAQVIAVIDRERGQGERLDLAHCTTRAPGQNAEPRGRTGDDPRG